VAELIDVRRPHRDGKLERFVKIAHHLPVWRRKRT
jgi:hypothetical protein